MGKFELYYNGYAVDIEHMLTKVISTGIKKQRARQV